MPKNDSLPRLYLPLLLLLAFVHSWRPLGGGYDFFAHAAVGRWIFTNHQVPHQSLFIWSAPPHYSWVAHSWLSQLLFFGVIKLGGPFAVIAFTVLCVGLVFGLIWKFWAARGRMTFVIPMLFSLAMWCSAPRFFPRQELLTAIILVILLGYIISWRDWHGSENGGGGARILSAPNLAIVAMFVLWVNLHALVLVGLVFLMAAAFVDWVQYKGDRRSWCLLILSLFCLAATCVNPFGIHVWSAADVLKPGSQAAYVDEWKEFWIKPKLSLSYVVGEGVLVIVALLGWWRGTERRYAYPVMLLMMTVMFVHSRRQLWMLAITALMMMAACARSFDSDEWWAWWRRFSRQPSSAVPRAMRFLAHAGAIIILVLNIVMTGRVFAVDSKEYWPPHAISKHAPVHVAQIIRKRHLPGRIFNDYETSSYLQWTLNGIDPKTGKVPNAGLHPLYIDLLNAYPDKVMVPDYFDALAAKPNGLKMLDTDKINTIHLGYDHRTDKLVSYLNHSRVWNKLLAGNEGTLWTRRVPIH